MTALKTVLAIKSPAFGNNGFIPIDCTSVGKNVNPALIIKGRPKDTESFALILDDPDGDYNHWIMWNIPPRERIDEGSVPGVQGMNSNKENKYLGPCPSPGNAHHYHFKCYALNIKFDLPQHADKNLLLDAMDGHIIGYGELVGVI